MIGSGKSYGERAAEAAELAAQTKDPQLRQACKDLADGWARLARQEVALAASPRFNLAPASADGSDDRPDHGDDDASSEPARPE